MQALNFTANTSVYSSPLGDRSFETGLKRFFASLGDHPSNRIFPIIEKGIQKYECMSIQGLISELQSYSVPSKLCYFRHNYKSKTDFALKSPAKCTYKDGNSSCGHLELNGLAPLLVLGNIILEQDDGYLKILLSNIFKLDDDALGDSMIYSTTSQAIKGLHEIYTISIQKTVDQMIFDLKAL